MGRIAKMALGAGMMGLLGVTTWWLLLGGGDGSEVRVAGEELGEGRAAAAVAGRVGDGLSGDFPAAEYPAIATEPLIRVSLGLLAKNGVDLSRPMPSRHRVLASSDEVVERVAAWAREAGYEVTEAVSYREHGGVEHFHLDVVRTGVLEPREIEAQGREVFAAVGRIAGAHYQSWMGGIER